MCSSAVVLLAGAVFAQIRSGSITGLVTDPSNVPVAGAKVGALQTETKTSYQTVTSPATAAF